MSGVSKFYESVPVKPPGSISKFYESVAVNTALGVSKYVEFVVTQPIPLGVTKFVEFAAAVPPPAVAKYVEFIAVRDGAESIVITGLSGIEAGTLTVSGTISQPPGGFAISLDDGATWSDATGYATAGPAWVAYGPVLAAGTYQVVVRDTGTGAVSAPATLTVLPLNLPGTIPNYQPPTLPQKTQADFLAAFQALLPTGPVWPRDPDAVLTQTLDALMPTPLAQFNRATNLLIDAFPATAVELLPEWESTLGLPDCCSPANPTLEQLRGAIIAKLIASGGQSVPYFTAVAAALGYTVTVTEFWPYEADMQCELPCASDAWAFAWRVNAPSVVISYFAVDNSFADDPLETWDSAELVCRLSQLAPAHTQLFFQFAG